MLLWRGCYCEGMLLWRNAVVEGCYCGETLFWMGQRIQHIVGKIR